MGWWGGQGDSVSGTETLRGKELTKSTFKGRTAVQAYLKRSRDDGRYHSDNLPPP